VNFRSTSAEAADNFPRTSAEAPLDFRSTSRQFPLKRTRGGLFARPVQASPRPAMFSKMNTRLSPFQKKGYVENGGPGGPAMLHLPNTRGMLNTLYGRGAKSLHRISVHSKGLRRAGIFSAFVSPEGTVFAAYPGGGDSPGL